MANSVATAVGMDVMVIQVVTPQGLPAPGYSGVGESRGPGWWSGCLSRERVVGTSTPAPRQEERTRRRMW